MSRAGRVVSRTGRPPSRLMGMEQRDTNQDFLEDTIRVWQPRAGGRLTDDDAREITANVAGFFRLLSEWDQDARREASCDGAHDATSRGRWL